MSDGSAGEIDDELVDGVRAVLDRHPVEFALCFGSTARDAAGDPGDLDLAVEFDELRPDDDGYSDAYLRLRADLEETLSRPLDLVDVHAMPPTFARVAFEEGVVVYGPERRRDALERDLAGEPPSVDDARERVAAAVDRLRETSRG